MQFNEDAIVCHNFSFQYNDAQSRALKDVSFTVKKGELVCIIGANGSGKSTLCHALNGLIPHYFVGKKRGWIQVDGIRTDEYSVADISSHVGLVFQNPFNQLSYTADTVAEELSFGLSNRGCAPETMAQEIVRISQLMHIEDLLDRHPLELSGGQLQRVAFASTFILNPPILILDECTTQLDPLGATQIMSIVEDIHHQGSTIIMVDHDMERVAAIADKILVLHEGKLCAYGTPAEIFTEANLERWGIEAPDYQALACALKNEGLTEENIVLTEESCISMCKKVIGHD
ncbi:energy-coupling factor ABC transporter ATP-binding protein [Actinotignum urinale]|uniref:energy-coupling factor ABC transporter ATP-binding protein n=1 Tax=Actinotignum urinale TaxID=190146 RepID=UPI00280B6907|nr:ABC transporter ATP-binding protein [Actinotignum urinale]